jgi:hypothetical protein
MKSLEKHRKITLLMGIFTALVLVFSQLFYFQAAKQAATYCQNQADTEQPGDNGSQASFLSIPSSSIAVTPHIEINQELSFVLEILFNKENPDALVDEAPAIVSKFFQALFRVIIAPNAP